MSFRASIVVFGTLLLGSLTACKFNTSRTEAASAGSCTKDVDSSRTRWYDPYQEPKSFPICEKASGYSNIADGWGYKADAPEADRSCITAAEADSRTRKYCPNATPQPCYSGSGVTNYGGTPRNASGSPVSTVNPGDTLFASRTLDSGTPRGNGNGTPTTRSSIDSSLIPCGAVGNGGGTFYGNTGGTFYGNTGGTFYGNASGTPTR